VRRYLLTIVVALGLMGWWRYVAAIKNPRSLTTYAKAYGLTHRKCRRKHPVY